MEIRDINYLYVISRLSFRLNVDMCSAGAALPLLLDLCHRNSSVTNIASVFWQPLRVTIIPTIVSQGLRY